MQLLYRLLCLLLVSNVVLRTFTNALHVIPRIFNVADIPLVILICGAALSVPKVQQCQDWTRPISRRLVAFTLVGLAGCALNLGFFYLFPATSQYWMLVEPLLLFLAVAASPFTPGQVTGYLGVVRKLITLELVVGVLQLPIRIKTGESEWIHGTFPGNAEQYAVFLMLASFYFLTQATINPRQKRRYFALVGLIQLLNIAIDNKASWLGAVISLTFVIWRLGATKLSGKTFLGLGLLLALLGSIMAGVAVSFSTTLYKYDALFNIVRSGELDKLGKVKAYVDILRSHVESPHMLLVGSGFSTFYSRGSRQFYLSSTARERLYANPGGLNVKADDSTESAHNASDAVSGLASVITTVPYYQKFYGGRDLIYAIGSIQLDQPFSPYAGLLGETGLLGAGLYLGCYLFAFRRLTMIATLCRDDPESLLLSIMALGLIVYFIVNSLYGPFLETTRMTTILWSLIGLARVRTRLLIESESKQETLPQESADPNPSGA